MNIKLKKFAVGGITAAILASGGAAYAYWTTTGSGSAQGSVPSANGTISLSATAANAVAPGQSSDVTFTAVNNGDTDLYVGTISSVITVTKSGSTLPNADFGLPAVAQDQIVPAHSTVVLDDKGTLSLANSGGNQDQLKGASISIALSSN